MMKPEWRLELCFFDLGEKLKEERDEDVKLFWRGKCLENDYSFEKTIRTFCRNYPEKEAAVLETLYISYLGECYEMDENFFYVLQWLADYEMIHGQSCFTPGLQEEYGVDFSVEANVEVIFDLVRPFSPVCDIAWILENRFNVDSKRIEYCLENTFMYIFCGKQYTLKTLLDEGALNEFFGHRIGYEMFLNYMDQIPIDPYELIDYSVFKDDYSIEFKPKFISEKVSI